MNDKDTIAEFYDSLNLKQEFMGYSKCGVLDSYKKLDSLYNEQITNEKANSAEQIKVLTERIHGLESRVEELDKQNRLLSEENGALHGEITSLTQSDNEKQAYYDKADMLSTAMLNFEREKEEQEKQLTVQRQNIIKQAYEEAEELSLKFKTEYTDIIDSAKAQIEALQKTKGEIVDKMRQLNLLIIRQIESLDADKTEAE